MASWIVYNLAAFAGALTYYLVFGQQGWKAILDTEAALKRGAPWSFEPVFDQIAKMLLCLLPFFFLAALVTFAIGA